MRAASASNPFLARRCVETAESHTHDRLRQRSSAHHGRPLTTTHRLRQRSSAHHHYHTAASSSPAVVRSQPAHSTSSPAVVRSPPSIVFASGRPRTTITTKHIRLRHRSFAHNHTNQRLRQRWPTQERESGVSSGPEAVLITAMRNLRFLLCTTEGREGEADTTDPSCGRGSVCGTCKR